jgi:hypothetical protein
MDKWQIASAIATIVQGVVVIISLIFIWRQISLQTQQISLQTKLAKAANIQSLVGLSSPFNLDIIKDPQLARFWVEGAKAFNTYNDVDRYRYKSLLIWWLILHENVHYQWKKGLLDEENYLPWLVDLKNFVVQQQLHVHWGDLKHTYQREFIDSVSKLIQEVGNSEVTTFRERTETVSSVPNDVSHSHSVRSVAPESAKD